MARKLTNRAFFFAEMGEKRNRIEEGEVGSGAILSGLFAHVYLNNHRLISEDH